VRDHLAAERRAKDELKQAIQQAEEASRLKDDFLATVSHELRTPLTAVLGWAHLLRSNNLDEAGRARALETIERNALSQRQLIEDLLDVSRIISGKLRLDVRPVEPSAFIDAAVEAVRPAAEAKEIRIQKIIDKGVGAVSGDPARLQQVVWNLLSNAIKFTPRGGRVQLRLERVDSHIEISVTDTGQGISAEFLPFIFERFRQADMKTTRAHGGLGLGLAIVRQLVELHGGTVEVESPGERQASDQRERAAACLSLCVGTPRPAAFARGRDGVVLLWQTRRLPNATAEVNGMMSEGTLEKAREAFHRVQRDNDLEGWGLDDKVISPFLLESNSDRLTVSLIRGEAERTSISLDLKSLLSQEGAITVMGLIQEIETALREKNILS